MPAAPIPHPPERICAFYSRGPHFVRLLQRLRAEYPGEIIVAAIPADFPFEVIAGLADESIRMPAAGKGRAPRGSWRVLRDLRRARCSHIVVMFDSPRLNLLARLSGAAKRWCFSADGRLRPLTQSLPGLIATPLLQRIRGQFDYLHARLGTARRCRDRE